MSVIDFETRCTFRVKEKELERIKKIVEKDNETFYNISHFVRCAVLQLLRKKEEELL